MLHNAFAGWTSADITEADKNDFKGIFFGDGMDGKGCVLHKNLDDLVRILCVKYDLK
jgi:hypothetical protein